MANTLYEYYTGQGKKLPSVQERQGVASSAGIQNYTGTAEQNNTLLKHLTGNPSAVGPSTSLTSPAAQTFVQNQTSPQSPASPVVPQAPSTKQSYMDAYKAYIDSQKVDKDVENAKTAYNDFIANQAKSIAGREGRGLGIPLQIVRGEQERLLKQTQPEAQRLQGAIGIAQDAQTGRTNQAKLGLDFNRDMYSLDLDAEKERLANERAMNPAFELSPGQSRYQMDPKTGEYKVVAQIAPKPTSETTKGTTRSGTLVYSADDQADDSQALEASRGTDGYVDPTIYENLYEAWVKNGGLLKDFLTKYPPKNYVNPANTWLPPALRPTASKSAITNPFQ